MDVLVLEAPDVGAELGSAPVLLVPEAGLVRLPPGFELAGQSDICGGRSLVPPVDGGLVDNVGDGALPGQGAGGLVSAVAGWREVVCRGQDLLIVS